MGLGSNKVQKSDVKGIGFQGLRKEQRLRKAASSCDFEETRHKFLLNSVFSCTRKPSKDHTPEWLIYFPLTYRVLFLD